MPLRVGCSPYSDTASAGEVCAFCRTPNAAERQACSWAGNVVRWYEATGVAGCHLEKPSKAKEQLKRERVWILTDQDLIEGTLFQPTDIRLSDAVNAQAAQRDRPYMALTDAIVTRIETGQEILSTRFLLVSRGQVVVMMPKSEVLACPIGKRSEPIVLKDHGPERLHGSHAGPALKNWLRSPAEPSALPPSVADPGSRAGFETGWAPVETAPPSPALTKPGPEPSWPYARNPDIETLVSALNQHESSARVQALVELERYGPGARSAVPALIEALSDKDSTVREWAATALGKIGVEAKSAIGPLTKALEDKIEAVRRRAVMALRRIEPEAEIALPILTPLSKDTDEFVREWAVMALGNIGPAAKSAVPLLIDALDDEVDFVRRAAADALGKIGPDAAEAVPALTHTLKDKDVLARYWAAEALKRIQGKADLPA